MAWLWFFGPVFGLSNTLYYLTICEKDVIWVQSSNYQHGLQESLQKLSDFILRGEVPCQMSEPSRGYSSVRPHTAKTVFTRGESAINLKLKSSFTKVEPIIPEKITQLVLAIQYRYKKRCTNCQDHEEMKPLLKQKLKRPTTKYKTKRKTKKV